MADINFIQKVDLSGTATYNLGKIQTFSMSKDANLFVITLPTQDSGATEAVDTLGVSVYIDITGTFTGTVKEIQSIIYGIQNLINGYQLTSAKLISPFVAANTYVGTNIISRRGGLGTVSSFSTGKLIDNDALFTSWHTQANVDHVKNLLTGDVAKITSVDGQTQLTLDADIFPVSYAGSSVPYAFTGTMNVKFMSFNPRWENPATGYCTYNLKLVQVA